MQIVASMRVWRVTLQITSLADVRRIARRALGEWGIVPDDIVLMVDELVTNALVHGLPPVEVALRLDGALFIEVTDAGEAAPRIAAAADEHGRGLYIVATLAEEVGVVRHEHGKTVWARAAA